MTHSARESISSTSNATVKRLVRLRDNRKRRRSKTVIVDGWHEIARAIDGGLELISLYLVDSGDATENVSDQQTSIIDLASKSHRLQFVTRSVMEKISYGQSPRGVVAEFKEPSRSIADLQLAGQPLVLVLDRIEKPGNIGAVFRCADAAGIDAVVLCDCDSDLFNPNAIRNSLGAVFTVPAASATDDEVAEFLMSNQIRPIAARVESSSDLWTTDLGGSVAIILGNETQGLGNRWTTLGEAPIAGIRIPMLGRVDSLNISISAAVIAYEAARGRRENG